MVKNIFISFLRFYLLAFYTRFDKKKMMPIFRTKLNKAQKTSKSKLKWWFDAKLGVEVSIFFVKHFLGVLVWFFYAFGEGFSKNIVGHNSSSEPSITWNWFIQLYILLSVLIDNLWCWYLRIFLFDKFLSESFWLWQCELIVLSVV